MKRDPSLQALSREHHTALSLANRIGKALRAGDPAGIEAARLELVEAARTELAPHFEIEETHLLPMLAAHGEAALAERMLAEHNTLRRLADGAAEAVLLADAIACLSAFVAVLIAHVRFEERDLFERIQAIHGHDAPHASPIAERARTVHS